MSIMADTTTRSTSTPSGRLETEAALKRDRRRSAEMLNRRNTTEGMTDMTLFQTDGKIPMKERNLRGDW